MISYNKSCINLADTNITNNDKYNSISATNGSVRKTILAGVVATTFFFSAPAEIKSACTVSTKYHSRSSIDKINKTIIIDEKNSIDFLKLNCCTQIQDLCLLGDNWDGYGAIKVLPLCISNAQNIINYKSIKCDHLQDIYANPNGTVSILWENENEESLGLEIGKDTFSYYIAQKQGNIFVKNAEFSVINYQKLSSYISLL